MCDIFLDNGKKMEKKEAAKFMNNCFITVGEELNQSNNTNWTQHSYFQSLLKDNFFSEYGL